MTGARALWHPGVMPPYSLRILQFRAASAAQVAGAWLALAGLAVVLTVAHVALRPRVVWRAS